eukprot:3453128-Pleurochrysis_carterae.AAC.1
MDCILRTPHHYPWATQRMAADRKGSKSETPKVRAVIALVFTPVLTLRATVVAATARCTYLPGSAVESGSVILSLIVPHSLVPSTLSFAYGARPSQRGWGEQSGYASNPVELATHRLCGVG